MNLKYDLAPLSTHCSGGHGLNTEFLSHTHDMIIILSSAVTTELKFTIFLYLSPKQFQLVYLALVMQSLASLPAHCPVGHGLNSEFLSNVIQLPYTLSKLVLKNSPQNSIYLFIYLFSLR